MGELILFFYPCRFRVVWAVFTQRFLPLNVGPVSCTLLLHVYWGVPRQYQNTVFGSLEETFLPHIFQTHGYRVPKCSNVLGVDIHSVIPEKPFAQTWETLFMLPVCFLACNNRHWTSTAVLASFVSAGYFSVRTNLSGLPFPHQIADRQPGQFTGNSTTSRPECFTIAMCGVLLGEAAMCCQSTDDSEQRTQLCKDGTCGSYRVCYQHFADCLPWSLSLCMFSNVAFVNTTLIFFQHLSIAVLQVLTADEKFVHPQTIRSHSFWCALDWCVLDWCISATEIVMLYAHLKEMEILSLCLPLPLSSSLPLSPSPSLSLLALRCSSRSCTLTTTDFQGFCGCGRGVSIKRIIVDVFVILVMKTTSSSSS